MTCLGRIVTQQDTYRATVQSAPINYPSTYYRLRVKEDILRVRALCGIQVGVNMLTRMQQLLALVNKCKFHFLFKFSKIRLLFAFSPDLVVTSEDGVSIFRLGTRLLLYP